MSADASHIPVAVRGSYPRRAGNAVRPLIDGEPAFRRITAAVEGARHTVRVTVPFVERDLVLPGVGGTLFDLLDCAAARGLDVRAIFWREPQLGEFLPGAVNFEGTAEDRAWLAARGSRFLARWDTLSRCCHHQKSWIVDDEVAFVGGINLDHGSMVPPGHPPVDGGAPSDDLYRNVHDLYLEIRGPAATDVHHNFVQRWNEASERTQADGVWPDAAQAGALPFPAALSPPAGPLDVQITRTLRAGYCRDGTPPPGAERHAIEQGEESVLEQYLAAIDAARSSIYLENQFLASRTVLARLEAALARGVTVVFVVPGVPMAQMSVARFDPKAADFFAQLAALGRWPRFTLAGLATTCGGGRYEDVYVHAKAAVIDDAWLTIGSTNVIARSFRGDTEMNASVWDGATARALRVALLQEHLGLDTSALDDVTAFARFAEIATANRDRRQRGEPLTGLAFRLDPANYGV